MAGGHRRGRNGSGAPNRDGIRGLLRRAARTPLWLRGPTLRRPGFEVTGVAPDASPPNALLARARRYSRRRLNLVASHAKTRSGFDAASEFAIEHQGMGLAALAADAMALVVAAIGAAAVGTLLHVHATVHAQTFVFSTTLVRLFVSVPLMALLLAGSRARWRLRTTVGGQLSVIAPAVAAGGLISLAGWRLASGAGLVQPPASDALMIMCAMGILTVADDPIGPPHAASA